MNLSIGLVLWKVWLKKTGSYEGREPPKALGRVVNCWNFGAVLKKEVTPKSRSNI